MTMPAEEHGDAIGTGYAIRNGIMSLFQWDSDHYEWDIPWDETIYNSVVAAEADWPKVVPEDYETPEEE